MGACVTASRLLGLRNWSLHVLVRTCFVSTCSTSWRRVYVAVACREQRAMLSIHMYVIEKYVLSVLVQSCWCLQPHKL